LRDAFFEGAQFHFVVGAGFENIAETLLAQSEAAKIAEFNFACQNGIGRRAGSDDGVAHECFHGFVRQQSGFTNGLFDVGVRTFHLARSSRETQPDGTHEVWRDRESSTDAIKIVKRKEKADARLFHPTMSHLDLAQIVVA